MKLTFPVYCLLLLLCSGVGMTKPTLGCLDGEATSLEAEVALLKSSVTKCESGLIESDYCNPPKAACFNKKKTQDFNLRFQEPPAVTIGIVHLDLDKKANTRVKSDLEVETSSLSVTFGCWSDSGCFMAKVSWLACGPVSL